MLVSYPEAVRYRETDDMERFDQCSIVMVEKEIGSGDRGGRIVVPARKELKYRKAGYVPLGEAGGLRVQASISKAFAEVRARGEVDVVEFHQEEDEFSALRRLPVQRLREMARGRGYKSLGNIEKGELVTLLVGADEDEPASQGDAIQVTDLP